jgi:maltooligosyltrehalose trehalohydrolase
MEQSGTGAGHSGGTDAAPASSTAGTHAGGPGAHADADGTVFRVWAPAHERIDVVLEPDARTFPLEPEGGGWFAARVAGAAAGDRYRYRLSDGTLAPDPASRFQPDGPHGASEVIAPDGFEWTDSAWPGIGEQRQVLYELHVGTFTPEGTWAEAAELLPRLAELGVTIIEVMPVAEFAGSFNWGYDGVSLFAPAHVYGRPADFRRFVNRAHALGLGVILDVVYNHVGPDGAYLQHYSPAYFATRYTTDWGDALNFDGPDAAPVREFFLANAERWIREYHLDGLRLDATQNIYDAGTPHILDEIVVRARSAASPRRIWIVAENEPQHAQLIRARADGGYGMDALWNDDFHHSAMVALTGRAEAYYSDHRGTPQEFVSAAKHGFLYQGQHYAWQKQRRGTPALDIPARRFVNFLQNHDQVANSTDGRRVHQLTSGGELRALTALLLLMPGTAMLFQGQEYGASAPFLFFADHKPELADSVRAGRAQFMTQFPSAAGTQVQQSLPDPADRATFERSKLDPAERAAHSKTLALHRDLIHLSRTDPVFAAQDARRVDGAVLGERAFVLRYFGADGNDRLLLINLGEGAPLTPSPEPLLAPPAGRVWAVLWSSDDQEYGGVGTAPPEREDGWHLPGRAAVVLRADVMPAAGARSDASGTRSSAGDDVASQDDRAPEDAHE